jgi:hypothetical protein
MKTYDIKNMLLCISANDLIKFNILKSDNLALVRLNSSELSKIISKILEINITDVGIIDFSYYGIIDNEINYDVKFYVEGL